MYKKWLEFINKHEELCLYGAGQYAIYTYNDLKRNGRKLKHVMTSCGNKEYFFGYNIFRAKDILSKIDINVGIIVALSAKYLPDVFYLLKNISDENIFIVTQDLCVEFRKMMFMSLLSDIPSCKYFQDVTSENVKKILVIRLDLIGDMIWTSPFLRELRSNYPYADITLIARPGLHDLLENCPYVDKLIFYDNSSLSDMDSLSERARKYIESNFNDTIFDIVITPRFIEIDDNLFLSLWTKCRARYGRSWNDIEMGITKTFVYYCAKNYYTDISVDEMYQHNVLNILNVLKMMGGEIKSTKQELWVAEAHKKIIEKYQYAFKEKISIAVGMFSSDSVKEWLTDNYSSLFNYFNCKRKDVVFLIFGTKEEKKMVDCLPPNCIDLIGKTALPEVAALVSRCNIYMGSDTSIMHMAATYEKKIIEISPVFNFYANHPYAPCRAGAWNADSIVLHPEHGLEEEEIDYCNSKKSHCINLVTVNEVEEALEKYLSEFMVQT